MLWSKNTSTYGLLYIIEQCDFNPNYIWDHKWWTKTRFDYIVVVCSNSCNTFIIPHLEQY